jgi:acetyltransferase-like isoleucine patch superfamily enzyme
MTKIVQKGGFTVRKYLKRLVGFQRKARLQFLGMRIGEQTVLPKIYVSWPHKVSIGKNCRVEHGIYLKFDGVWEKGYSIIIKDRVFLGAGCEFNISENIVIGDNCLIASGCRFIDHDHGMNLGELMSKQPGHKKSITIGNDVWLGCNVVVLKGVEIADGAVVAAGAVVNKSIGPNEIWGGVPAKKIGERK